jgi:Holliday junction DNA helicase RuvA
MIATLHGKLEARGDDYIIVSVGGIGFKVRVPAPVIDNAGAVGSPITLYTHLHVRENELALFGCASEDELALFKQLQTVTGVGPRLAMSFLSTLPADTLRLAIAQGQVEVLTQVPGVGKKLAQRIVVELKGKIDLSGLAPEAAIAAAAPSFADAEVLAALTNLGYSTAEAQAALRRIPPDPNLSLEEKIMLALRSFAQG